MVPVDRNSSSLSVDGNQKVPGTNGVKISRHEMSRCGPLRAGVTPYVPIDPRQRRGIIAVTDNEKEPK